MKEMSERASWFGLVVSCPSLSLFVREKNDRYERERERLRNNESPSPLSIALSLGPFENRSRVFKRKVCNLRGLEIAGWHRAFNSQECATNELSAFLGIIWGLHHIMHVCSVDDIFLVSNYE